MTPIRAEDTERRLESLTVNLLECYEELDLIYRLSRGLMTTLDAQESARLVLREAMEIFEADLGWMAPWGPGEPAFATILEGTTHEALERLRRTAIGDLIPLGRSQIYDSVPAELRVHGDDLPDALLCAAVRTEAAVYGALCVGRRGAGRRFTARDLKLSNVLTTQAALAIEHTILQRRWREEEQTLIRFEEEMRLARAIQARLLPGAPPRVEGFEIACRGLPARSVGGDYYDFIPLGDDRLALCLADVSGKGMPAALLMANLQATIRSQALSCESPAECARRSNRLLYRSTDTGRFATCFFGVLDLRDGRLRYSNAGHDHPLIVTGEGSRIPLVEGGLGLGMLDDQEYGEGTVTLEPGHVLVAYSDGITETFDAQDREFGREGLEAVLARTRGRSADEILDAVLDAARRHAGDRAQWDDMTLVVLRRL